jgi:hypothetical protein
MKKFIAVLILTALIIMGASAQSQLTWSAWGRGVFTPIAFDDKDSSVSTTTTWGDNTTPNLGFTLNGTSESGKIGFIAQFEWLDANGGAEDLVGENAKIWVKPFPFLKLTMGKFNEDDLRGTVGTTEFNSWLVPSGGKDEDNIFTRFQSTIGAHIAFIPVDFLEGLFVEAAIGTSPGNVRANRNLYESVFQDMSAGDIYKAIHVGIGYKIPDIGFVRAQYIGNNRKQLRMNDNRLTTGVKLMEGLRKNKNADIIEAAFQFNMIEDLNIDIGVKIPLPYIDNTAFTVYPALRPTVQFDNSDGTEVSVQLPIVAALGAKYNVHNFAVLARVDFGGPSTFEQTGSYKYLLGPSLGVWVCPSYSITSLVRTGLDFGFEMHLIDTLTSLTFNGDLVGSDYSDIGIGPWVELNIGGGMIKTGVMMMFPNTPRYTYNQGVSIPWQTIFSGKPVISIPISVTYSL